MVEDKAEYPAPTRQHDELDHPDQGKCICPLKYRGHEKVGIDDVSRGVHTFVREAVRRTQ